MSADACRPVEDYAPAPGYRPPLLARGVVWADVLADIAADLPVPLDETAAAS